MIRRCVLGLAAVVSFGVPLQSSAQAIPTPESILGQRVGADFFLATFEESMGYFEALARASDRVTLRDVGESSFGRTTRIAFTITDGCEDFGRNPWAPASRQRSRLVLLSNPVTTTIGTEGAASLSARTPANSLIPGILRSVSISRKSRQSFEKSKSLIPVPKV